MGQHQSMSTEGQEHASYQGQNSETAAVRGQVQREVQGHSPSQRGHSEQSSSWTPSRTLASRKNGMAKESTASTPSIATSASPTVATSAPIGNRSNRSEADLGRMSVREAIDSFIESRLSAPNESPPPPPPPLLASSLHINGFKSEDSRSSRQGEDSVENDVVIDKTNKTEAEDYSHGSSIRLRASGDSLAKKDMPLQPGMESRDDGAFSNDCVDEDSERMSDKELVIDCDATESLQATVRAASSTPPKDSDKDYQIPSKSSPKNQSPINLSDTSCGIKSELQDLKNKDSDTSGSADEQKTSSPSSKQEKQTFSAYLQDRLKAQLASHVDSEAQGQLYLWDLNKASTATNAAPVSSASTITRTGSVRLQTLIDKVLDQSIGKSLATNPSDTTECNSLFASLKQSAEMSSSSTETKTSEKSNSVNPPSSKSQDSLHLPNVSSLCFKDHIDKVVVENFLSYQEEEKNEAVRKKDESSSGTESSSTSVQAAKGDVTKDKRDAGVVGPDGTFSVHNIVDRVISQTKVISKLLTPAANDQISERVSPGRNRESHGANHCSPTSGQSAVSRAHAGSHGISEGQRGGSSDGQPSITVGRKRGRPRLSSPVSRPNAWPSDRSIGPGSDRGSSVFRDPQSGDYRKTSSQIPGSIHGHSGGPAVPQVSQNRPLPGQVPPPLDIIASQGSIQHGIPVSTLVPQQVSNQIYHSQLHPHHPHAHPSDNSNSSARPILTSSVPSPHSPHHNTYQRVYPHLPQPPSPHGHAQHHHRPSDHLPNHHPSLNKPLPPLIHANHINEKTGVNNNSSVVGGGGGSGVGSNNSVSGGSRLVPVSHIPTASCSCSNCVAIYSRDKAPHLSTSSLHQQPMRRSEVGGQFQMTQARHSDIRRDEARSHHPYSVFHSSELSTRGDQLATPQSESLKPVVGVGGKAMPHQAVIPSFVAARRPIDRSSGMEAHPRDEHYPRDSKPSHYPYSPQGKPSSAELVYAEDERYRSWLRAQNLDPHASSQATPYPSFDQNRRAAGFGQRQNSPEKVPPHQPQPLDLQKSGYPSETPMTNSPMVPGNADQPLDLSVKSSSETRNREAGEIQRQPSTLRNETMYQDRGHQRSARELDPRDTYGAAEGSVHGRPDPGLERPLHLGHAYPPGQRSFTTPPGSQYPQTVGSKDPLAHPPSGYGPRADGRSHIQAPADRQYPSGSHLISPNHASTNNSRESPTQRSSRHGYPLYPLTSSSSPSLQLPQQQPPHTTTPQPPGLSLPPHLRGAMGPSHGSNLPYQRRSPYSDINRPPKHQDPRAPSPHYSNVGSHQKTPDAHNYPSLPPSQDSGDHRGAHNSLPPPSHPQPGVSPDEQEALKHCVSKHEPIQNIIGNHPQNDILYLICKLCRQTYGSPYGFRRHFRNQHGFEPKVEHTIVQTISATKTAMGHSGPGDHLLTDAEKKAMLASEAQGPQCIDTHASIKAEYPAHAQAFEKHSQDSGLVHTKGQSDLKGDFKGGIKSEPKLEPGVENTKCLECPECGQTFQLNDFGSYKRHCRQHSVTQYSGPFSCHDCQKSFAEPGQLQQHLNTHKSFTPSLCGLCPTFFSSPHYLAGHLKAAHGHVVPSEALKKSPDIPDLKHDIKNEKPSTLDLHGMIETALMESNVPHCSKPISNTETKIVSSSVAALSSSHQEHISPVSSSISSLPLSKRHKVAIASSDVPVLTTVHTPKKLEVQKLPADAVVTTASPDSSFEEGRGQGADCQPRLSTSGLKSGHRELNQSPLGGGNSQSQGENKEFSCDSQDSNSNHSILSASGGVKKDDNKSRSGLPPWQAEIHGPTDKGSNKDDTESVASDRCQSVDSNSQSIGGSRTSSPGCDDADKFYKHKKYSRHRKRMSSSDVPSEPESKTPKLSTKQDNDQTLTGSVSSSNSTNTIVQACESSSGQYEGKSGCDSGSLCQEEGSNSKITSKAGKGEKCSKEARQEDNGKYGPRETSYSGDAKKSDGGDTISKFKWDRLTRSQTGKSPQAVSCSNS